MTRVAGIDPGTVSVEICGLEDGSVAFTAEIPTSELAADPGGLRDALGRWGPLDGAVAPSGYGLPLARLSELDDRALRLAFLSVPGGTGGIPGLVRAVAGLREADEPVWVLPGVVHLPTVPEHRKVNRIDMGTADKLCSAALGVADQTGRLDRAPSEADFLLLELGGAFTSVLSVQDGAVADGIGGSSGPPGVRGPGGLDGEVAVVLGEVRKRHVFSGGAVAVASGRRAVASGVDGPSSGAAGRTEDDGTSPDPAAWAGADGPPGVAWRHLMEGAEKACRSLLAVHPRPREILLSGRHASHPAVLERLTEALGDVAPVRRLEGLTGAVSAAAQGAALLADGLAGGRQATLVETLALREAAGTVFDHLYLDGVAEGAARWLEA
jgi:predicted butyrate kinase (DUF1464 family)